MLTLASQQRILANLPIVWFTDNEALKSFLDKEPPLNARLRKAYLFLSQFALQTFHLPGLKKGALRIFVAEGIPRIINLIFNVDFESLAREAFTRMDTQIDLCMHEILSLTSLSCLHFVDKISINSWKTPEAPCKPNMIHNGLKHLPLGMQKAHNLHTFGNPSQLRAPSESHIPLQPAPPQRG